VEEQPCMLPSQLSLLLLLLSLGCATTQNTLTWKTFSGKLNSPRFPPLFLDKFCSILHACDLVWSISCFLCLKFSFFSPSKLQNLVLSRCWAGSLGRE
jgi:hypothetical protein